MAARRSSGIQKLDDLIEGGFKEGSVVMIEGDAGSGKSTLAIHYLLSGVKAGEKVIYLSIEESEKNFLDNMGRFGFNIQEYQKTDHFLFYECNAQRLREFLEKGILGIEDKISQMHATRLVIDSVSAFALLYETEAKQRTAVQRLFEKLKSWGITTLIISESSSDYSSFGLQYIVDGWIRMRYKKVGRERIRTIEVLKMRGTKHQTTEVVYRIEDNGINLYPSEKIFDQEENGDRLR